MLNDHVLVRYLQRARGVDAAGICAKMRGAGFHGPISEGDFLWWLEHRMSIDLAAVRAEIHERLRGAQLVETASPRDVRLRSGYIDFICEPKDKSIRVVTVLPAKLTLPLVATKASH